MTLAEFQGQLKGYQWREEQEWQRAKWLTWHIEALARTKKLPKFEKFVDKPKPKRSQTPEEMLAVVVAMTQAFGGEDRRINKEP